MDYQFRVWSLLLQHWEELLWATWLTIRLSGMAMGLGLAIAILLAGIQRSHFRILRSAVRAYIEPIRNTPFLVQLFLVYFGLPSLGVRLDPNKAALVALALNAGAYCAEIVRAGIESVDRGQIESAVSLGLKRLPIFCLIILPQAIRAIYPALTSQFMLVILNTSVASAIAAEELTAAADNLASATFQTLDIYIIATGIYFLISLLFSILFGLGERLFFWSANADQRSAG